MATLKVSMIQGQKEISAEYNVPNVALDRITPVYKNKLTAIRNRDIRPTRPGEEPAPVTEPTADEVISFMLEQLVGAMTSEVVRNERREAIRTARAIRNPLDVTLKAN